MLNYSARHSIDVDHIAVISTSSSSAVDTTHRNRQPGNVTVFLRPALERPIARLLGLLTSTSSTRNRLHDAFRYPPACLVNSSLPSTDAGYTADETLNVLSTRVTATILLISFIAYSSQIFIIYPWYGRVVSMDLLKVLVPFK